MEIPYEVSARRDTGLYNAKVGIWLFLASEVMLFGGLFSAYVFLRVGIDPAAGDIPWPVAVQKVWIGFINTLVLIASSVFVVFSWLALKERNWRKFQWWMSAVLACALAFLVLKAFEYHSKLTHHGIILKDDSVLEGEIKFDSDLIRFEADKITKIDLKGGLPGVAGQIILPVKNDDGAIVGWEKGEIDELNLYGKVTRTTPKPLEVVIENYRNTGEIILADEEKVEAAVTDFRSWFLEERARYNRVNRQLRITARELSEWEKQNARDDEREPEEDLVKASHPVAGSAEVFAKTEDDSNAVTIKLMANPTQVQSHGDKSISFNDGAVAEGKLINDTVIIEVHEVDLQMIPFERHEGARAWELIKEVDHGDFAKKAWFEERDKAYEHIAVWYEKRDRPVPREQKQAHHVSVQEVHLGHHEETSEKKGHEPDPGDSGSEEDGAHPENYFVQVPREDIKFMSSHSPRYHPYYAIYFTMTGLHGLHVLGGMLVLGYMLLFGKKLYLKNPEHMANRVEVGGLFWHFVDLVWIFLFPIMYLF